jgi:3',5'-nucleoside bisphosphate phosphatase
MEPPVPGPPRPGGADLHLHSHLSDGVHPPRAVMERSAAAGLSTVALTDHDSTEGLATANDAARRLGLRLIPGIELSCAHEGHGGLHLLAWFIDPGHAGLGARLDRLLEARRERFGLILEALGRAGVHLDPDATRARAGGRAIGRPHIAAALVAAGFARHPQDAFDRWLKVGRPGFVRLERLAAAEAIDTVHAAGGVTGLAHPGLGVTDDVIEALARLGLAALEVDHPAHAAETRRHYRALAERLGLVATGGSDFHDEERGEAVGSERVTDATLAALEARRR